MANWFYSIGSVIVVSMISLAGVFSLSLNKEALKKTLIYLVSFAVGALFGDAFFQLIPESFKRLGFTVKTPCLILTGIIIFFVIEKFINWSTNHGINKPRIKPYVSIIFIGDLFHNFIDGIILGASYTISIEIGLATSLAVILHEIPHEVGDFSAFVHGGLSVKKALILNFTTALVSILGAVISLFIGTVNESFRVTLLPITAGGFIYLAGSDLIPELKAEVNIFKSLAQILCILTGAGLMLLLLLI
jgi:zinc and cadmium transporter